jgi:molybdopterin molybdotransferase
MTGAVLPAGADTVIAQECVQAGEGWITLDATLTAGENVRVAGEDAAAGEEVLGAGLRIDARGIALLAAFGLNSVPVVRPVRVGLLSTGSELRGPGAVLASGDLYDSNRPMLAALLSRPCVSLHDLGTVPDDPEQLAARFAQTADLDLVVVSGGVSVGEADWVRPVLAQRGRLDFWRVAVKPGRPLVFGRLGNCWLMGLPGNPVSAYVTFRLFVEPVVARMAGMQVREPLTLLAPIGEIVRHRGDRTSFLRGRWITSQDNSRAVIPLAAQGSAMLTSLAQADCLIELPAGQTAFPAGTVVKVWPL